MGLTTGQLNDIVAQWDEWVTGEFDLSVEVKADAVDAAMVRSTTSTGRVSAGSRYCQVRIRRGDVLLFDQRVPHDAGMLRASVTTIARYLATQAAGDADR